MVFNSLAFLIFFPIVLLLYRIVPLKVRWIMLLCASYFFYCSWQPDLLYLILFTTAVSYASGLIIDKSKNSTVRRVSLIVTLVCSLSVLLFFKYFNFLADTAIGFINLFGAGLPDFSLNLILPVGISFYTFQTLSYVIDVYRGSIKAERHFGYYALYVSYFPQLVAGPIERPENLLPQLKTKNPFNAADTALGLKIMAVGFFKKIVVADQIAPYVNAVYNNMGSEDANLINGFTVCLATVLFAFQIYCDFSGYTDIAIGVGRVMGIKLMQNFNMPYTATNIKDFWKRWHISLTSWFTDYIYIPLGGSRCAKWRHYLNIVIVFLISGIWHGAAFTFIIWGAVHAAYQVIGSLTIKPRNALLSKMRLSPDSGVVRLVRRGVTFILVCLAWVCFRANSVPDMLMIFREIFTGFGGVDVFKSLESLDMNLVAVLTTVFSVYVMSALDKHMSGTAGCYRKGVSGVAERSAWYITVCWCICIAWMILLAAGEVSSFIYFQF